MSGPDIHSPGSAPAGAWPAVDCGGFGEPFDAFPVESHFQVKPDLVKLLPADDWLRVDRQWSAMVAAKQAALAGSHRHPPADNVMLASPCGARDGHARLDAVLRICEKLAATAAGQGLGLASTVGGVAFGAAGYRAERAGGSLRLVADRADASPVLRLLSAGSSASRLLGALAMSLQEDLVLMERGRDGIARAALFHVSFPSAWNPAAKLGQDLLALHEPVADNTSLQAAAGRLGHALVAKGPFVRWVWTVTADSRWRAWPPLAGHDTAAVADRAAGASPDGLAASGPGIGPLYFRVERQTTMPLGEGYGLFLIRVQVRPLEEVLQQPGRLGLLQASLRSMSDAMVRYKSLAGVRERVLAGDFSVR